MSGSDGVLNPAGAAWAGSAIAFLAAVPATSYLTADGGVVQKAMETLIALIPGSASIAKDRMIPALSAFFIFAAFGATGAASVAAQAMARKDGLDNNSPRAHVGTMHGLPLRMRSAHYNIMEMFPGFALAAALAQTCAPGNQQIINLLGLHVLLKSFLYYPSYLADIAPTRSLAHVGATGAIINVAYRIAMGAS